MAWDERKRRGEDIGMEETLQVQWGSVQGFMHVGKECIELQSVQGLQLEEVCSRGSSCGHYSCRVGRMRNWGRRRMSLGGEAGNVR